MWGWTMVSKLCDFSTLLEKFYQISMWATGDAVAKLYVTKSLVK